MKAVGSFGFLSILIFCTSSSLFSQQKIQGIVVDSNTLKPISNAHVFEDVGNKAVISDSLGKFQIGVDALPVLLSVSHITYHPKGILIDRLDGRELEVRLVSKNYNINEVVVIAERLQQFFKEEVFYVREMEFGNGIIWVLGNPEKSTLQTELRVLSLDAKSLAKIRIKNKCNLYKDAYGEVYLDFKDSLNQLYWEGQRIIMANAFLKDGSEEYLYSLQTSFDSLAILKRVIGTGVYNEYIAFSFKDYRSEVFHYSFDHDLFANFQSAKRHRYGTIPTPLFKPFGSDRPDQPSWSPTDAFTRYSQDRLLTYTPINSKLFKRENELLIFEDKGPFIWKYDLTFKAKGMIGIQIPEKSYHIDMLKDPISKALYIVYDRQGKYLISKLNLEDGSLISSFRIEGFTFIENLRIYGNRVYYLDQSRIGSQTMNLFSLRLTD